MPLFQVDHVSRVYGRRRGGEAVKALDDVCLTITAGQRWGIVGESGSGKTTLLRLLAGLDSPTSGRINFAGVPLDAGDRASLDRLRSGAQLVFQDPRSSLDPRMKVGEIITEPLRSRRLRRLGGIPADLPARLAEVLAAVDLPPDAAQRYPHEFSGGQRQRIAIARALAPKPAILLADEPVSALDVSVRAQVLNLITELVAAMELTLILVSHDLAIVRHLCDQVAVIHQGRIVETAPAADLFAHPQQPYTQALLAAVPQLSCDSHWSEDDGFRSRS